MNTSTGRYISSRLETNRAVTDELLVGVNGRAYYLILKKSNCNILQVEKYCMWQILQASHLEAIPCKTWEKNPQLYWLKYCMDWKLAEGLEAKIVDVAVI